MYLNSNLGQQESFYYWGWNPGIYWLTSKETPFVLSHMITCTLIEQNHKTGNNNTHFFDVFMRNKNSNLTYPLFIIPEHNEGVCEYTFNYFFNESEIEYIESVGGMRIYGFDE